MFHAIWKTSLLGCFCFLLFSCGNDTETNSAFKDERDGEVYKTVKIGDQLWMAENMRYKTKEAVKHPDKPEKIYGYLYPIEESRNVCPEGWRLASGRDWLILEMFLGMRRAEARKGYSYRGDAEGAMLKSDSTWGEQGNGTNSVGFNLLSAGFCERRSTSRIVFSKAEKEELAAYWVGDENEDRTKPLKRTIRGFSSIEKRIELTNVDWDGFKFSCRCVKDTNNQEFYAAMVSKEYKSLLKQASELVEKAKQESLPLEKMWMLDSARSNYFYAKEIIDGGFVEAGSDDFENALAACESLISENNGNIYTFFTDKRDSQIYKTLTLGKQTWMAENLNYAITGEKYCGGQGGFFCEKYGQLYTWDEAIKACPKGWHLPSDKEWNELEKLFGLKDEDINADLRRGYSKKMMAVTSWLGSEKYGTDSLGFRVLSAGRSSIFGDPSRSEVGDGDAYFWTASTAKGEDVTDYAITRRFYVGDEGGNGSVMTETSTKDSGYPCRCVKN